MSAKCFYCGEAIQAMALRCPHCRSDFLPAYTDMFRSKPGQPQHYTQPASGGDTGLIDVIVIGTFFWLCWEGATWLWATEPVQWLVGVANTIIGWF